jgi:hypothetical protein
MSIPNDLANIANGRLALPAMCITQFSPFQTSLQLIYGLRSVVYGQMVICLHMIYPFRLCPLEEHFRHK